MKVLRLFGLVLLLTICWSTGSALAGWEGEGSIDLGYTFLDQVGNRSASPETYDVYDDLGISLRGIRLRSTNGYQLNADFSNINLENRSFNARLRRPGRMNLSGFFRKTRRVYDFEGTTRTYRTRGGLDLTVMPYRTVKLSGGYSRAGLDGNILPTLGLFNGFREGVSGSPEEIQTDYSLDAYYFGAQFRLQKTVLGVRYRGTALTDNLDAKQDRSGRHLQITVFSPLPGYERLTMDGLFSTGWNRVDDRDNKRKETLFRGGGAWSLTDDWSLTSTLRFSRTDNEATGIETDNAVGNLFALRQFAHRAEAGVGYEFRSQDDLVSRTEANAFILRGMYRPLERLRLRGQVAFYNKEDNDKTTLVGDEDVIRHRFEVRYDHPDGHRLTIRYRDRRRDFEDIGAEADYQSVTSVLSIKVPRFGTGTGSYAYSKGDYRNTSSEFAFEQHVLTAQMSSVRFHHAQLSAGLTYLRSRLSSDLEKILFTVGADVVLRRGYSVGLKYQAHTYDDFVAFNRYYTANVFTVNVQKTVQF